MRLLALNDSDLASGHLSLQELSSSDKQRYAILSHRWTDDEVLFEDIYKETSITKAGWFKLKGAISRARVDGLSYLWIDTCCIDKSSSAELSEAINSMWAWYRDAATCYAYLCDVSATRDDHDFEHQFGSSGWFTRGWTLQELIAPLGVTFYNETWSSVGTKHSLQRAISDVTGIEADYLDHKRPLSSASIAKRMSWAAQRKTTRDEDLAYCLMGIFSVNMPMLYGEGMRAFQRLQEEILRTSDDESIFAWKDKDAKPDDLHGLLADKPWYFQDSGEISPVKKPASKQEPPERDWRFNGRNQTVDAETLLCYQNLLETRLSRPKPLQVTNMGLNMQRCVEKMRLPLYCGYRGHFEHLSIAIVLLDGSSTQNSGQYARFHLNELDDCVIDGYEDTKDLYFPQAIPDSNRFRPVHEAVLPFSLCLSERSQQSGISAAPDQVKSGIHPLASQLLAITGYRFPREVDRRKIYCIPRSGTHVDLVRQYESSVDKTYIFIMLGVVEGATIGFAAGIGSRRFLPASTYSATPTSLLWGKGKSDEAYNKYFIDEFSPIGSTIEVGTSHRVTVRRQGMDLHDGTQEKIGPVEVLEIDIMTLDSPQIRAERHCCCVQ